MDAKLDTRSAVEKFLNKALDAKDASQAVGFSQAACNAAHVLRLLSEIDRGTKPSQD